MALKLYQVDAFTSEPFSGNPAAVTLLPEPASPDWMQKLAREMNLSETAFLTRREGGFELRWFTPAIEIELCGHATLASAHVLWEQGELEPDETAAFHTLSGWLKARRDGDWIELDFPAEAPEPVEPPAELCRALGVEPLRAGRNRFDYLIEIDSEKTLRGLRPDFARLEGTTPRGVIVTSRAETPGFDFVSRFFAPPSTGVSEDPVTGSAHCCLGPYWSGRTGKDSFTAYQASARGGVVPVRVAGERVLLGGDSSAGAQIWREAHLVFRQYSGTRYLRSAARSYRMGAGKEGTSPEKGRQVVQRGTRTDCPGASWSW